MAGLEAMGAKRFGAVDLALLGVALIWGGNTVVVKYVLRSMTPLSFNGVRFILAAVSVMALLVLSERSWWLPMRDWAKVAWIGFLGYTLYQYAFIEGIARTTASNAGLILALVPLIVAVWSGVAGHEQLSRRLWLGVALSLIGAGVVILARGGRLSQPTPGDVLVGLSCFAWAAYTIYSRQMSAQYSALKLTAWAMVFGSVFLVILCLPALARQDWSAVPPGAWAGEVYSFSLSIVAAFIIYGWAMQRLGGPRTALYISLNPIFAAVLGWLWLAEVWTPVQWAGALLAIGGVVYARWV